MLDSDTRRRIDTARDILVGKVPDPKSQVEQITIALIYKFMDDMDAESEELGGKRTFFAGEFARYAWHKLVRGRLGGQEMLNLYVEAIMRMPENQGIPPLFREIFKNAYLPYRDPETLRAFLKVIDEFEYDHSERLGDAFEYLLSVLGSQGDAGQFRTPRHIIDFIVGIVDPKKHETVLDPACGTAGFLISAYKHILAANRDEHGQSTLTPDERRRLVANFTGYDISPDMVRLSLVNLYLHGFPDPHIHEYDTLTSEERWNDRFDVILANPPFMSPKGGIRPHNRFGVQSKRSEVLFVDYIAEHLTPSGRAGIIVPEGIIFQSQTAYRKLRKLLVEEYLVAVISLPAGVFNPYSGVKTSILILDRALARQADTIAFFKVENDGYSLGAQRREIEENDLPQIAEQLAEYFRCLQSGEDIGGDSLSLGQAVTKRQIAAMGEYNLSGDRYRVSCAHLSEWPQLSVDEIAIDITAGFASGNSSADEAGVPHLRPMNITKDGRLVFDEMKYISEEEYRGRESYSLLAGDVLFNNTNSIELVGKTCLVTREVHGGFSNHLTRIRTKPSVCLPAFLALALQKAFVDGEFSRLATRWVGQAGINTRNLAAFQVLVPTLEVQRELVAEIEGYQKVIDGARAVIDNYRPHIPIDPSWPLVRLGKHYTTVSGGTPSKAVPGFWQGSIPWVSPKDMKQDHVLDTQDHISEEAVRASSTKLLPKGTIVCVVRSGILKHTLPIAQLGRDMCINQDLVGFLPTSEQIMPEFLLYTLKSLSASILNDGIKPGVTVQSFRSGFFRDLKIPMPSLDVQEQVVAMIEREKSLVSGVLDLVLLMNQRAESALERVYGNNLPNS